MTPSGVEANLTVTPFAISYEYSNGNKIVYYFSSETGLNRFTSNTEAYYNEVTQSLTNRFKMKFKISRDFTDVALYRKCERRGFRLIFNGREIKWPIELEYNGQSVKALP